MNLGIEKTLCKVREDDNLTSPVEVTLTVFLVGTLTERRWAVRCKVEIKLDVVIWWVAPLSITKGRNVIGQRGHDDRLEKASVRGCRN